jgi:outer membrane protein insertion porin family
MSTSNSLNNKNIRLSERLFIPSRNLRGFESGKVGPKDGTDFIGGNFSGAINFSSNLPKFTENFENIDLGLFIDAANLWGVDYDSSLESNNGIRSSIGLGVDWSTPIGPLSFSFATPITKENTDVTEFFRFNIGTTF